MGNSESGEHDPGLNEEYHDGGEECHDGADSAEDAVADEGEGEPESLANSALFCVDRCNGKDILFSTELRLGSRASRGPARDHEKTKCRTKAQTNDRREHDEEGQASKERSDISRNVKCQRGEEETEAR